MQHISFLLSVAFTLSIAVSPIVITEEPRYHPEQLATLDTIFSMTNGNSWLKKDNWQNSIYCLRYGVTCDVSRNVIGLSLPANNLEGSLPSFANFSRLQTLDLSSNTLVGLPSGFGAISTLTSVQLQGNVFQGALPAFPKSLTYLDVSNNFFIGDIASILNSIPNVVSLNLAYNTFTGNLSRVNFPAALTSCNLQNLPFVCPVPDSFSSKCAATCSNCATLWNSCDYCLDTVCGWCQLAPNQISKGVCMEISYFNNNNYRCGISGLLETTCTPECTNCSTTFFCENNELIVHPPTQCANDICTYETVECAGCNSMCQGYSGYCCPASNPVCSDNKCCCTSGHSGGCGNNDGDCIF